MCGRFALFAPPHELEVFFGLERVPDMEPRYNIAPTQKVALIRRETPEAEPNLVEVHWGLIPSWAKDPKIGARMINARSETVFEKPAFRKTVRYRRGLIPADGFFEWQRSGKAKKPFFFRRRDKSLMALAALWDEWTGEPGTVVSGTILTAGAAEPVARVHDRMPVILDRGCWDTWLDPNMADPGRLAGLLGAALPPPLDYFPVTTYVNAPMHEGPECIAPAE